MFNKMFMYRLVLMLLVSGLAACVPPHHASSTKAGVASKSKKTTTVAVAQKTASFKQMLSQKSDDFLYMAGRAAIEDGNIPLAISFLSTLASRSLAVAPRLELAQLYVKIHRAKEAAAVLQPLQADAASMQAMSNDERMQLQQLYAVVLQQQQKTGEAEVLLRSLLKQHPKQVAVRVQLARLLMQQGKLKEAGRLARAGLKAEEAVPLLQLMVDISLQQKMNRQALQYIRRLRAVQPDSGQAVILHAVLLTRQGKANKAEKMLRAFIAGHPSAIGVANHLGRLLIAQKRLNEAVKLYRGMLRHGEAMSQIYAMLGMLYYEQKQFAQAADAFREALRLEPENNEFRFHLAINLDMLNRTDEALAFYQDVPPESERYAASQMRMAAISMQRDDLARAEHILQGLLEKKPDTGDAWGMLAAVYLQRNAYRLLLDRTEPALKLKKIPRSLLINRAIAYDHFKEYQHLEQSIQLLLKHYPDDPEALNFIGYSLAERGIRLAEAKAWVEKALKLRPDNGFYLDSLAWVYYQQGDYQQAEKTQRQALQKVGRVDPVMYEHLGDILWRQGKHELARQHWQQALEKLQAGDGISIGSANQEELSKKIAEGLPAR